MTDHTLTEDDVTMISYFWREKSDLERWCDWGKFVASGRDPIVVDAWQRYKLAQGTLDAVVRSLEFKS